MVKNTNNSSTKIGLRSSKNSIDKSANDLKAKDDESEVILASEPKRPKRSSGARGCEEQLLPKHRKTAKSAGKEPVSNVLIEPTMVKKVSTKVRSKVNKVHNEVPRVEPGCSYQGSIDPVVGSARSLINSIKSGKLGKRKKPESDNDSSDIDEIARKADSLDDANLLKTHVSDSEDEFSEEDESSQLTSGKSSGEITSSDSNTDSSDSSEFSEAEKSPNNRVGVAESSDDELDPNDPKVKRLLSKLLSETNKELQRPAAKKTSHRRKIHQDGKDIEIHRPSNIKSPSDTTLYAPALHKALGTPTSATQNHILRSSDAPKNGNMIDHISEFVERIRIENKRKEDDMEAHSSHDRKHKHRHHKRQKHDKHRKSVSREDHGRKNPADGMVLEAKRFKAGLVTPKGNNSVLNLESILQIVKDHCRDEEDDFFHISCHIDEAMRLKIGRGEFVELEKLLPKNRMQSTSTDKGCVELIQDGVKYRIPSGSNNNSQSINSICRWEAAFRVYAAVYSKFNPERAAEIWQYAHTINSAATTYIWDNVAFYDYTFRQMMSAKPKRSWAKISNQTWNYAMRDHIPIRNSGNGQSNNWSANRQSSNGDWCDKCCWRYDKGKCSKWNCRYDHRCMSCGAWSHPKVSCNNNKGGQTASKSTSSPNNTQKTKN